jgi:hypothetical protein
MKRLLLLALFLPLASQAGELSWPVLKIPAGAQLTSPGESIAINGMPVKIYRYETALGADTLGRDFEQGVTQFVRRSAPGATGVTYGGRRGDFWLTLQVAPLPNGHTQATWSAAPRFVPGAQLKVSKPPGFPSGAQLLQQVDSFDAGKSSQLAIGLDPAAVDAVAARLQDDLRGLGYTKQAYPPRNWSDDGQYAAVFANGREELVVSLRPERGGTSIVVNRISALERLK